MKPKRRVQAQRKFAQGAIIPPHNISVTRAEVTLTPVKEDCNIIHNNLSAKNMLDFLSFRNMHSHKHPVVVIERMPPSRESLNQKGRNSPVTRAATSTITPVKNQLPKSKLKLMARNSTMCLRSWSRVPKKPVKKLMQAKRKLKPSLKRCHANMPTLKLKRRRELPLEKPANHSNSDIDDEIPLKFFKSTPQESKVSPDHRGKIHEKVESSNGATNTKAFKKPAASTKLSKGGNNNPADDRKTGKEHLVSNKTNEEHDTESQETIATNNNSANTNKQYQFYGSSGIVRWLESYKKTDISNEKISEKFLRAASPCPSKAMKTVKDVVTAPMSVLARRCKSCCFCRRVTIIEEISRLMQKTRRPVNNDDVYEFNAERDDAQDPPPFYVHRKRRASRAWDAPPMDDDESHVYLDVLTESPHVVQMTFVKIPNTKKRMMRARLVPRVEAQTTQDVSLIEHEDLFDQLLETLKVNNSSNGKTNDEIDPLLQTSKTKANNRKASNENEHLKGTSKSKADNNKTSSEINVVSDTSRSKANNNKASNELNLLPVTNKSKADNNKASNENELPSGTTKAKTNNNKTSHEIESLAGTSTTMGAPNTERPSTSRTYAKLRTKNLNEEGRLRAGKSVNDERKSRASAKAMNEEAAAKNVKTGDRKGTDGVKPLEAPVYYPSEAEFNDPIAFFEKIMPTASKFGLCKVVAPENFKPKCNLNEEIKFNVTNHYMARMYNRWGPAAREMSAMKAYLATQNVNFSRVPLLESLEVNLPKLYLVVQRNGGLKEVIEKKRWGRVAEEMRFSKGPSTEKTLDSYYVKYLLPYDTATNQERQQIMCKVEKYWSKKYSKLVEWALNPLHQQKKLLGESDSSEDEAEEDPEIVGALLETEDCVVGGRPMNLSGFKKVAKHAKAMYVPNAAATPDEIEEEYWRLILFGNEHVCVNAASIDTGVTGIGFSKDESDPCGRHPWNLKMISENSGNELRSLGAVLGVTVPTLHLGMVFSTSCWNRDPHGLPWIEYMHEGPSKKWYGIPDEQSSNFRQAVESLCPTSCQNKSIWLSSDITMIPPNLLREHNVLLSHVVQNPGEYIIVFPKAYSCSISTGFTISESVYFATNTWLRTVHQVMKELRESCEPTTFSVEQLLLALAQDQRCSPASLLLAHARLDTILQDEISLRGTLAQFRVSTRTEQHLKKRNSGIWNVRDQAECLICRATLYLSKVTGVLGKKSSLCLFHAVKLLKTPRYRSTDVFRNMELVIFYTENQLQEIISSIEKRLFLRQKES